MKILPLGTLILYFAGLLSMAFYFYRKQRTGKDFILGDRGLNFYLTAFSAHASDMSSWLFVAYPALIFTEGVFQAWVAVGLTVCMFLNWQFIAPRLRLITEQTDSLTLNAYFENRFADCSGLIRTIAGLMTLVFFTIYISSGLVALGLLVETLLSIPYSSGVTIGVFLVMIYVFMGGYTAVAWIDLIQGLFLLGVIVFIPVYLVPKLGGMAPIIQALHTKGISSSLFPDFSTKTLVTGFLIAAGWGLGYLGQPHILTKFMGIKNVTDIKKSKWIGMSWQVLALGAATLIGMIGVFLFASGLKDPQFVTVNIVNKTLAPFFAGLVICAILAATTNVMSAQILVVASSLAEDFYKRWMHREASQKKILFVSRMSVIFVSILAFIIAIFNISTIYELVLYAWSGLGASFGPLVLISLYTKKVNKYGAFCGILVGGISAGIWPYFEKSFSLQIPALVLGFILSSLTIGIVSYLTRHRQVVS